MHKYTFYFQPYADIELLKYCPPSYQKPQQQDYFLKYLKYANPIDHIRLIKFGVYPYNCMYCYFCTGNTFDMCSKCTNDLIFHVEKTIIQLSLPKMIDICIILRQLGLVNDIINHIININE